ncbi:unnamed protein product [Larinioides sclopetarius]|uniref:Uncharacterized protein n=1 Tax=Larinioides sclopetarius TaxID=280406 RepID=A0AAV2AMP6_9ARAC
MVSEFGLERLCKFYEHRHYFSDYEPVFTDGSKSEDHVGTAVVMGSTIISEKMHKFCSVFTSEVYGGFSSSTRLDANVCGEFRVNRVLMVSYKASAAIVMERCSTSEF